jgi:hypothetical protein
LDTAGPGGKGAERTRSALVSLLSIGLSAAMDRANQRLARLIGAAAGQFRNRQHRRMRDQMLLPRAKPPQKPPERASRPSHPMRASPSPAPRPGADGCCPQSVGSSPESPVHADAQSLMQSDHPSRTAPCLALLCPRAPHRMQRHALPVARLSRQMTPGPVSLCKDLADTVAFPSRHARWCRNSPRAIGLWSRAVRRRTWDAVILSADGRTALDRVASGHMRRISDQSLWGKSARLRVWDRTYHMISSW